MNITLGKEFWGLRVHNGVEVAAKRVEVVPRKKLVANIAGSEEEKVNSLLVQIREAMANPEKSKVEIIHLKNA